jgi:hypothetical protein
MSSPKQPMRIAEIHTLITFNGRDAAVLANRLGIMWSSQLNQPCRPKLSLSQEWSPVGVLTHSTVEL